MTVSSNMRNRNQYFGFETDDDAIRFFSHTWVTKQPGTKTQRMLEVMIGSLLKARLARREHEKGICMYNSLSHSQKLAAMALKYYNHYTWQPKPGDYYTTARPDFELYQVVNIENDKIYTQYTTNPGQLSEWDLNGFTSEGFGICRVYVPDWILQRHEEVTHP